MISEQEIKNIIAGRIITEEGKHSINQESWELIAAGKIYSTIKDIIINKLNQFNYDDVKYEDVKQGIDLAIKIVNGEDIEKLRNEL